MKATQTDALVFVSFACAPRLGPLGNEKSKYPPKQGK